MIQFVVIIFGTYSIKFKGNKNYNISLKKNQIGIEGKKELILTVV